MDTDEEDYQSSSSVSIVFSLKQCLKQLKQNILNQQGSIVFPGLISETWF